MNLEVGFSLTLSRNMKRQLATVWGLLVDMFVCACMWFQSEYKWTFGYFESYQLLKLIPKNIDSIPKTIKKWLQSVNEKNIETITTSYFSCRFMPCMLSF